MLDGKVINERINCASCTQLCNITSLFHTFNSIAVYDIIKKKNKLPIHKRDFFQIVIIQAVQEMCVYRIFYCNTRYL